MFYNWAGYLLLVPDETSPLIHIRSTTFDGRVLIFILKQGAADEAELG